MAQTASPYGLRPYNLIGGQPFNGGAVRQITMTANSATAVYTGDIVLLGAAAAGQPSAATATPTTATAGVIGVCVGVSYTDPVLKQSQFAAFLPANAVNSGYTNIRVHVNDDPDQLYIVQASAAVGLDKIGKNAPVGNFGGSQLNGNSTVSLTAASIANTATLGLRIVDLVNAQSSSGNLSQPGDAFTECIVKFNFGVHTYLQSAGSTN